MKIIPLLHAIRGRAQRLRHAEADRLIDEYFGYIKTVIDLPGPHVSRVKEGASMIKIVMSEERSVISERILNESLCRLHVQTDDIHATCRELSIAINAPRADVDPIVYALCQAGYLTHAVDPRFRSTRQNCIALPHCFRDTTAGHP
jgi:hypothetical protein